MTVREWLDENLSKLHGDAGLYKTYRRIMENWQFARIHAIPDSAVMSADIEVYLDDENFPLDDKPDKRWQVRLVNQRPEFPPCKP